MKLMNLVMATAMAVGLSVVAAGAAPITSLGALGSNDSIDWGQLGGGFITTPQSVTSVGGLGATVSSTNGFERIDQSSGWNGNFTSGDHLIWTTTNGGPDITILFNSPVRGVGAQIQADFYGAFTAEIHLSNGDVWALTGNSNGNGDGSAIFLGALDGVADISSITFDLTNAAFFTNDFAIDKLYLRTGEVPEPLTMSLFGAGLVGAFALRRRKKQA